MTANEKKYVPASMTSTVTGLVAAINTPARTGPRIWVSCVPLLRIALKSGRYYRVPLLLHDRRQSPGVIPAIFLKVLLNDV